jgi:16S rRNA (cytidine1402-2'-O)-methyltransferase
LQDNPHNTLHGGLAPGLYIVSAPIGNVRDITLRAIDVLSSVDAIAAEDTRVTRKLLEIHGIKIPKLIRHDEHGSERSRPEILARLAAGEAVALATDAGTPLVSDPGYKLVVEAVAAGHKVTPLPGPSAALAALTLAGLPSDRFMFLGFLPSKPGPRCRALGDVADIRATLVFFEGASRLAASLADMAEVLGDRPACVARELTKLYEEARRGSLLELSKHYQEVGAPKGEVTLVVAPPIPRQDTIEHADARLIKLLEEFSVKDAAKAASMEFNLPKSELYSRAVFLKKKKMRKNN